TAENVEPVFCTKKQFHFFNGENVFSAVVPRNIRWTQSCRRPSTDIVCASGGVTSHERNKIRVAVRFNDSEKCPCSDGRIFGNLKIFPDIDIELNKLRIRNIKNHS